MPASRRGVPVVLRESMSGLVGAVDSHADAGEGVPRYPRCAAFSRVIAISGTSPLINVFSTGIRAAPFRDRVRKQGLFLCVFVH